MVKEVMIDKHGKKKKKFHSFTKPYVLGIMQSVGKKW